MICPSCHGAGYVRRVHYPNCPECNGQGITYCCEGLTQGVTEMPTKIEYWEDPETPDNTGWYINSYGTLKDMAEQSPEDSVGPYDTKTQAIRMLRETTNMPESRPGVSTRKPHDPSNISAVLDAGIPTDAADEDQEF
jgi:hypothetical protein